MSGSRSSLVVVGLDLSLTATGLACIEGGMAGSATVTSKGATKDSLEARNLRLAILTERITDLAYRADRVAVESPSHGSTSGHHHDRSGLWWMVTNRLLGLGIRVYEVAPTQVKKYATGKGNASKAEVMIAAVKRYPEFDIMNDNEADAVILAALLSRALGQPIEDSITLKQQEVVDGLRLSQVGTGET